MGASITLAGESLIAQKQGTLQILDVTRFVLANIPGLDTTLPIDRAAGLPAAELIVHTQAVTRQGYLNPNQVVYSLMLGSDIGDFDFNWIGLLSAEDVLVIAASVPRQQKRREIPPVQTGNNLTRNIVLEYNGAQALTGINVPASTWQFDFSAQFASIDERFAQLQSALDSKIDADSWNPPQAVSLDGPTLVYVGSANAYKITDFSRFSAFSATTTVGTVSIAGDTLTLIIPTVSTAVVATLEVRRDDAVSKFRIPIGAAAILAPTIVSPANQATGVSLDLVLTASAFEVYPVAYDIHKLTRWQVALDVAFTQLVFDKTSATELTSIRLSDSEVLLAPGKRHYTRAYYSGETLVSGEPVASTFNTATTYIRRPSIVSPTDGQEQVSRSVTIQSDPFSVYGGADVHLQSRFQITAIDTGLVLFDSGWVSNPLTSFKPSENLPTDTWADVKVKYRGQTLGETEWSPMVRFKTAAQFKVQFTNAAGGATPRSNHAAASVDGLFYIVGGVDSGSSGDGLADLWCYNPSTNAWLQKASLPEGRFGHSLTAIGGKLYCFGGRRFAGATYKPLGTLLVYDPATDKWTAKTGGTPVYLHGAVAMGGKLYVYGGQNDGSYSKTMRVYDPVTDKWATLPSLNGPLERQDGHMVVLNEKIHYFAGIALPNFPLLQDDFWAYNLSDGTWSERAKKPPARSRAAVCVFNELLYVFGGAKGNSNTDQLNDCWMYDSQINDWTQLSNLPTARTRSAFALAGDSFYIHGGILPPYTFTNSLLRID
jgi:N-acetylneuraminic acid mutarotase